MRLREILGAAIFKALTGTPSGPVAFAWLRSSIAFKTSFTLRMVNLKGSVFGGASSGANSDSISLEFAKREDAIDVKYEFIAFAMSLCPCHFFIVNNQSIDIAVHVLVRKNLFESFPKLTWVWSALL